MRPRCPSRHPRRSCLGLELRDSGLQFVSAGTKLLQLRLLGLDRLLGRGELIRERLVFGVQLVDFGCGFRLALQQDSGALERAGLVDFRFRVIALLARLLPAFGLVVLLFLRLIRIGRSVFGLRLVCAAAGALVGVEEAIAAREDGTVIFSG